MSEDLTPYTRQAGMDFHQAAVEIIYHCNNEPLMPLRELQNLRRDAEVAMEEIAKQIALHGNPGARRCPECQQRADRNHKMDCSRRALTAGLTAEAQASVALDGDTFSVRYCGPHCQARRDACTGCGDVDRDQVADLCQLCRDENEQPHSWCPR